VLSKPDALKALRSFFKKNRLARLPDLYTLLGTPSRMSVFRRLRELNYLSSYSHAGRYYTLPSVAQFDSQGLWFYGQVGFSRFGNLKQTLLQLIDQSLAGKTHEELERQLRVRVHNPLLELVRSGTITREAFGGAYLYLSIRTDSANKQRARRHEGKLDSTEDVLPDGVVIEVLAEIIRSNRLHIDQDALVSQLAVRRIRTTASQLEQLCTRLDLKKTLGSV
jgi:hypothetical protein